MADHLQLIVVTPQKQVLDAPALWVDVPASSGELRALPEHAPTLGTLGDGTVRYQPQDGSAPRDLTVSGGFFEVLGDSVTLLADSAQ